MKTEAITTTPTPSPWVLARHPTSLGDPSSLVTMVDGQTFCLSDRTGDFDTNATHGVYFADMRVLSLARLLVDHASVEPLAVHQASSSSATFVGRHRPSSHNDMNLLVVRRRRVGTVWHEWIELRNYGSLPAQVTLELEVAADFADVFAVKEGRDESKGEHSVSVIEHGLEFHWVYQDIDRRGRLLTPSADVQISRHGFQWTVEVGPNETWRCEVHLSVAIDTRWIERRDHHPLVPGHLELESTWVDSLPKLSTTNSRLARAYSRSLDDLGSLRLHDPTGNHRPVIAAGAPWYMTLFGRDALITSYMMLPVDREMALGVLEALAELQGVTVDANTEEEPGRIVHETRQLGAGSIALAGHGRYYGSVDATPLFVVLLGELLRWGLSDADLERLLPHADRALEWVVGYGDRDGDGYVEYQRSTDIGLVNQGWKDSVDGIRYRDGRIATAPLALCEVQGYVYGAYRARAAIAVHLHDAKTAQHFEHEAAVLKECFNRDFWDDQLGWFAVALGPDKQRVDSLTSNIGHCLWSGIVDDAHARSVAERLLSAPMWTGWGVRTLAADEPGFDPMSYHCGSVWPHDGALCAAGLAAYGMHAEALTVANGLLNASDVWNGRLPEYFCGFDRNDIATPVPFPTSCSPQAWAAATPLLLLRVLIGLEPDPTAGVVVNPIDGVTDDVVLSGVRCGSSTYNIRLFDGKANVSMRPS